MVALSLPNIVKHQLDGNTKKSAFRVTPPEVDAHALVLANTQCATEVSAGLL
jgi:hypothetical protein